MNYVHKINLSKYWDLADNPEGFKLLIQDTILKIQGIAFTKKTSCCEVAFSEIVQSLKDILPLCEGDYVDVEDLYVEFNAIMTQIYDTADTKVGNDTRCCWVSTF